MGPSRSNRPLPAPPLQSPPFDPLGRSLVQTPPWKVALVAPRWPSRFPGSRLPPRGGGAGRGGAGLPHARSSPPPPTPPRPAARPGASAPTQPAPPGSGAVRGAGRVALRPQDNPGECLQFQAAKEDTGQTGSGRDWRARTRRRRPPVPTPSRLGGGVRRGDRSQRAWVRTWAVQPPRQGTRRTPRPDSSPCLQLRCFCCAHAAGLQSE